jgi:hypothetical protein
MTDDQKRIAIAEEDGWGKVHSFNRFKEGKFHLDGTLVGDKDGLTKVAVPPYLVSRDAIVPAILRRFGKGGLVVRNHFYCCLKQLIGEATNWEAVDDFALATADPRVLADAYLAAAAKP